MDGLEFSLQRAVAHLPISQMSKLRLREGQGLSQLQ